MFVLFPIFYKCRSLYSFVPGSPEVKKYFNTQPRKKCVRVHMDRGKTSKFNLISAWLAGCEYDEPVFKNVWSMMMFRKG